MASFKADQQVRYTGQSQDGGPRHGEIGTVLIAQDSNGDAHITFGSAGAGVWSLENQESLEPVDEE